MGPRLAIGKEPFVSTDFGAHVYVRWFVLGWTRLGSGLGGFRWHCLAWLGFGETWRELEECLDWGKMAAWVAGIAVVVAVDAAVTVIVIVVAVLRLLFLFLAFFFPLLLLLYLFSPHFETNERSGRAVEASHALLVL